MTSDDLATHADPQSPGWPWHGRPCGSRQGAPHDPLARVARAREAVRAARSRLAISSAVLRSLAGSASAVRMVLVLAVVLAGVCGTSGCGDHGTPSSDGTPAATPATSAHGPLAIFASNAALAYFAQRIGDASVRIEVPPEEGIDPAFWKPTAAEIGRMQAADVVLLNGAGYEHWRSQVALVERHVVETAESFRGEWIEEPGGVTHSHGLQGAHSHAGKIGRAHV